MDVEEIIKAWEKEKLKCELSKIESKTLGFFYNKAKTTGEGINFGSIVFKLWPIDYDVVKSIIENLEKENLIRQPKQDVYLISRKGFSVYETDYEVYSGILFSIQNGHSKGFKEIYINYICKGIKLFIRGLVKVYLRELEKQNLVQLKPYKKKYLNSELTELGNAVCKHLKNQTNF